MALSKTQSWESFGGNSPVITHLLQPTEVALTESLVGVLTQNSLAKHQDPTKWFISVYPMHTAD